MGWYLRKSLKIGPLRVNFSKSGIGYSLGVKGARIGTGPHGPYVAGGRNGIYFRQSLKAHLPTRAELPPTEIHPLVADTTATSRKMHCSQCGTVITPGNDFCIRCGTRVLSDTATSVLPIAPEIQDRYSNWPVIGGILIVLIGLVLLMTASKPHSSSLATNPSLSIVARPAVPFQVNQKAPGKPVMVWLPLNTSFQQVTEMVLYFKAEIQSRQFEALGIIVPTVGRQVHQPPDFSGGTVLFYRKRSAAQVSANKKAVMIAEYKWGIDEAFQKDSGWTWDEANHVTKVF